MKPSWKYYMQMESHLKAISPANPQDRLMNIAIHSWCIRSKAKRWHMHACMHASSMSALEAERCAASQAPPYGCPNRTWESLQKMKREHAGYRRPQAVPRHHHAPALECQLLTNDRLGT